MKISPKKHPEQDIYYDEVRISFNGGLIFTDDKKGKQFNFNFKILPVRVNPDTLEYEEAPFEIAERKSVSNAANSNKTGMKKLQAAFEKVMDDYLKDIGWK
jgi:hypothetical protein